MGQGDVARQTGSQEACQPLGDCPAALSHPPPPRAGGLSSCVRLSGQTEPSPGLLLAVGEGLAFRALWLQGTVALSCSRSLASWLLGGPKWNLLPSSVPQRAGARVAGSPPCPTLWGRQMFVSGGAGPAVLGGGADTACPNASHSCPACPSSGQGLSRDCPLCLGVRDPHPGGALPRDGPRGPLATRGCVGRDPCPS